LIADDSDSGQNGVVRYSVLPHEEMSAKTLTGDIYVTLGTELDYELRTTYRLMVCGHIHPAKCILVFRSFRELT